MSCSTQGISNAYVLQMRQPVQSTATVPIPQHSTTTTASIATPPATTNTPTPAITNEPATTATSFPSNTPLNLANNQSLLSRLNVDAGGGSRILLQQGPDDTAEYERNNNISDILFSGQWWKHVVAGALAGTISRTCTAPLDRTKVMLQVKGAQFTSIRACFKHMVSEGGKKSLWRGNGINVLKIGPESSIRFLVYEQVKVAIKSDSDEELGIKWRMLAGSIAGSVAQSVIYPLEVLKTRMCLRQTGQYKGLRDAWKQILRNEGIKAFYRGYWANLCGIIPYAGIDLAVYETLRNHLVATYVDDEPSNFIFLACAFVSSCCGIIVPYPISLIRTRLQAHSGDDPHTKSIKNVFEHIRKTEGLRGLYRGLLINIFKGAPAVCISYMVYENARSALGATMT